jgi:hypothetical protein
MHVYIYIYIGTNKELIHIFQFQRFIILYLVYKYIAIFIYNFFIQVGNLNLVTNLVDIDFMTC